MKEKDVTQHDGISPPGGDVVSLFSQALRQLMETSAKNCLQNLPEQVMNLSHQVHQIETKQQQFLFDFAAVKGYVEKLASTNQLLENADKMNYVLSAQHYEERIIEPMVRSLFVVIDLIEDVQRSSPAGNSQGETFNAVKAQLLQFFASYGIEIVHHDHGSPFNPQFMKPVSMVPTQDNKLKNCIAQSLQSGFVWNRKRLLRPESVSLYKFENVNVNLIKEGE